MELSCSEVPLYVSPTTLGFCLESCFLLNNSSFKTRVNETKNHYLDFWDWRLLNVAVWWGMCGGDSFQKCNSALWKKFEIISPLWSLLCSPSVFSIAVFKSRVTACEETLLTHFPKILGFFLLTKFQTTILSVSTKQEIVCYVKK